MLSRRGRVVPGIFCFLCFASAGAWQAASDHSHAIAGRVTPGNFVDITSGSGVRFEHVASHTSKKYLPETMGSGVALFDYDNDGRLDIFLVNGAPLADPTPKGTIPQKTGAKYWNRLFHQKSDGKFEDVTEKAGLAGVGYGMGVAVGDYDNDGYEDLYVTAYGGNRLYHNNGNGTFTDVTAEAGVGGSGWSPSAAWVDLDNDGNPDLFFVTGSVYPEVEAKLPEYAFKTPRVIFRNLGNGKFEELLDQAGPGVASPHASRGCAFGDFDNDGDVDMAIVNLNEPPSLLRNDVSGGAHWLKVKLVGVKSNRGAIGARVTAHYGGKIQAQEVLSQSSFYSSNDPRLHFGLGAATKADLEIRWPNGGRERVENVAADRLVVIREGAGMVKADLW